MRNDVLSFEGKDWCTMATCTGGKEVLKCETTL